jgi:hypothetical protein
MKKAIAALMVAVFVAVLCGTAMAADTVTQTVTYQVKEVNSIAVSGNPANLIIDTAVAGSAPTSVSDSSTTYSITTNGSGKKITGAVDSNMPAGTTLQVTLAAPTGGTSNSSIPLTSVASELVTGISKKAQTGLGITYTFSATVNADPMASTGTKTVTFTITN